MAKKMKAGAVSFPFYDALRDFYLDNKGKIRRNYKDITRKILDYNDSSINPNSFLRKPQFEAFEMYVFLKEFMDNKRIFEIFAEWANHTGVFDQRSYYSTAQIRTGQRSFFDTEAELYGDIFEYMKSQAEEYPNYIYALTMGLGKTILMGTCIFYEFLLAYKYPKDKRFCHNAIVFAPDKTVRQSLNEIITFDRGKVIPKEYMSLIDSNIKFHFLDDDSTTLNTIDNSDFNVIISNSQKIILKKKHKETNAVDQMFSMKNGSTEMNDFLGEMYGDLELISDDDDVISNQRFEKLKRLKQLGVYVDEAHHLFGKELKTSVGSKDGATSLRNTINELASELEKKGSKVIACYNYTGTPYVNNTVLPEVVSECGLKTAITMGYLKNPIITGYDNVKNKEFLKIVLTDFFNNHKDKTYEGLLPKIAIFGSTVDELNNEIRPIVEEILAELGVDLNKILVNVGDSKTTKGADIQDFNNLDVVGTEGANKQVILLVGKGREGWNCRSLFSVALFRSPKSTVFVLQATMRCLRKITDVQQNAHIYLSKANQDILDSELQKNFNITIKDINDKGEKKKTIRVKVNAPLRSIKIKDIHRDYELVDKNPNYPISFNLDSIDYEKYKSSKTTMDGLGNVVRKTTEELDGDYSENMKYSVISLIAEISRYLNMSCLKLQKLLENSVEGIDKVIDVTSRYNDIVYDVIIPKIFNYYYEVKLTITAKEKEVNILDYPDEGDFYEFHAKEQLVINEEDATLKAGGYVEKSFHTDNYCFDSKPEMEFFLKYIKNEHIKKVYFTGMFTSKKNGLGVQYIDPESNYIRHYYPDFLALRDDGTYELIEIKGDNKKDDAVVQAKAYAALELAYESKMNYKFILGSEASDKSSEQLYEMK